MIEYLLWSPDRETFISVMAALINPVTKTPLAALIEDVLVPSEFIRIDEIGEVVKVPAVLDAEGNVVTPAEVTEGHHVNMVAYGALAKALTAGGGWSGIFPLLGKMDAVQAEDGVPAGWEGASGVRIYPAANVSHRVRVWA
jgi:hypothetical protein